MEGWFYPARSCVSNKVVPTGLDFSLLMLFYHKAVPTGLDSPFILSSIDIIHGCACTLRTSRVTMSPAHYSRFTITTHDLRYRALYVHIRTLHDQLAFQIMLKCVLNTLAQLLFLHLGK